MKKKVLLLVGTRPNFIKISQFKKHALKYSNLEIKIVHTGQHSDKNMSDVFFDQFFLNPDYFLNIPQTYPASQIGEIMIRLEKLIRDSFAPNLLIVPGDVNSTLAGALVANKMNIKLAHLESGLRSFDRNMPEEINRILVDQISDHFFVTEQSAIDNIKAESLKGAIHFVGNTMIDTLIAFDKEISSSLVLKNNLLENDNYVLMTIHRPSNVDNKEGLLKLIALIHSLSSRYKVVFPIHPRTIDRLHFFGLEHEVQTIKKLLVFPPLNYFDFQKLVKHAKFIITDSGGVQEETTYRKIPCLTLRDNTERPITVVAGTNMLIPFDLELIAQQVDKIENNTYKTGVIPPLWDGKSTERIMKLLSEVI